MSGPHERQELRDLVLRRESGESWTAAMSCQDLGHARRASAWTPYRQARGRRTLACRCRDFRNHAIPTGIGRRRQYGRAPEDGAQHRAERDCGKNPDRQESCEPQHCDLAKQFQRNRVRRIVKSAYRCEMGRAALMYRFNKSGLPVSWGIYRGSFG